MDPLVQLCCARHLAKAESIDVRTAMMMIDDVMANGSNSFFAPAVMGRLVDVLTPIAVELSKFRNDMTAEEIGQWTEDVGDVMAAFFSVVEA